MAKTLVEKMGAAFVAGALYVLPALAVSVGDTLTWSNADGLTAADVTEGNHCSFALCLPEQAGLPAGSVVRVKNVKFASVNTAWTTNDVNNLNDPHSIAIGSVRSAVCDFQTSPTLAGKCVDSYSFSDNCDIVVGNTYPAGPGSSYTGMSGCGVTFLHQNGNRWSSGTTMNCTVGCTTSGAISNGQIFPVFELTAEVVSIPTLPIAYEYDSASGAVNALSDKWASSINNSGVSAYWRLGSGGASCVVDLKGAAGYCNMPAKTEAFTFALYADCYRMSDTAKGILAIFGNNSASAKNLVLYHEGSNIKLGFYTSGFAMVSGTQEASVSAPDDSAFHLITAVCDPTTGMLALYIDDGVGAGKVGRATPESVSVALSDKFQLGGVHGGGFANGFTFGDGCAVEKMVGFDLALTSAQVAELSAEYPVRASGVINGDLDYNGGRHFLLYDAEPPGGVNKYFGVSNGSLTIPEGSTVTVPHVRVLNNNSAEDAATLNVDGTLVVTSESTVMNVWAERNNYKGILFGHYKGTGTYNIRGSILGTNAYLESVYTAGSQTINVTGGVLKVKGIYANNNNSTINLTGDGTIEVQELPNEGGTITRNFRWGTFRVVADATESRAINFDAPSGSATTLDPTSHTLTFAAGAVTGGGDITVDPSDAGGKVVFGPLDGYSGRITVASGAAEYTLSQTEDAGGGLLSKFVVTGGVLAVNDSTGRPLDPRRIEEVSGGGGTMYRIIPSRGNVKVPFRIILR